jgi:hypothetical protein
MLALIPLNCSVREAPGGLFIGEIKGQITVSVLSLFNHYITTHHRHRVIIDFLGCNYSRSAPTGVLTRASAVSRWHMSRAGSDVFAPRVVFLGFIPQSC